MWGCSRGLKGPRVAYIEALGARFVKVQGFTFQVRVGGSRVTALS